MIRTFTILPLRFAFSHLTVRERQRKLGKNRLENDQILSARTICPVCVFIFHKFFVTFIFCLLRLQINDILNNLKLAHILRFSSGLFEFARPFLSANKTDDHFLFAIRFSCFWRLRNSSLDGFEDLSNSRSMWTSQTKKHR